MNVLESQDRSIYGWHYILKKSKDPSVDTEIQGLKLPLTMPILLVVDHVSTLSTVALSCCLTAMSYPRLRSPTLSPFTDLSKDWSCERKVKNMDWVVPQKGKHYQSVSIIIY